MKVRSSALKSGPRGSKYTTAGGTASGLGSAFAARGASCGDACRALLPDACGAGGARGAPPVEVAALDGWERERAEVQPRSSKPSMPRENARRLVVVTGCSCG